MNTDSDLFSNPQGPSFPFYFTKSLNTDSLSSLVLLLVNFKVCSIFQNLFWPLQILQSVPHSFFFFSHRNVMIMLFVCSVAQAGLKPSCLCLPERSVSRQIPPHQAFFLRLFPLLQQLLSRSPEGKARSQPRG